MREQNENKARTFIHTRGFSSPYTLATTLAATLLHVGGKRREGLSLVAPYSGRR